MNDDRFIRSGGHHSGKVLAGGVPRQLANLEAVLQQQADALRPELGLGDRVDVRPLHRQLLLLGFLTTFSFFFLLLSILGKVLIGGGDRRPVAQADVDQIDRPVDGGGDDAA